MPAKNLLTLSHSLSHSFAQTLSAGQSLRTNSFLSLFSDVPYSFPLQKPDRQDVWNLCAKQIKTQTQGIASSCSITVSCNQSKTIYKMAELPSALKQLFTWVSQKPAKHCRDVEREKVYVCVCEMGKWMRDDDATNENAISCIYRW